MSDVQRDGVSAPWRDHLKADEIQRLALVEERIARRKSIVEHDFREKKLIQQRAIRRMRRKGGKKE